MYHERTMAEPNGAALNTKKSFGFTSDDIVSKNNIITILLIDGVIKVLGIAERLWCLMVAGNEYNKIPIEHR